MAAAAPVRPLNVNNDDKQGNRCPICQVWEAPSWRGLEVQVRLECCGVLICKECFIDWRGERTKVIDEFLEKCGRKAFAQFKKRWGKKLRARVRGEKDKEEAKNKTKEKGGKKEDEKKRALEKLVERHLTCPSCRAPLGVTHEDEVVQLRRKAEQGHSWAQRLLGFRYRRGEGVRKDGRQAERWFRAALTDMSVMDGGPMAAFNLGVMYANGDGVRKDAEEAKKLFTMAHEAGHISATSNLGFLFRGGCGPAAGVPDLEKAFTLFHRAAETGHPQSQANLGMCYEKGVGVEQDMEKAKAWYAKAAKQGQTTVMYNLAVVLAETEGRASIPTQMALVRAAAGKGSANAQKALPQWEQHILSFCASCGKPSADMAGAPLKLKCARCKAAAYCSAACQKQHWKRGGHKKECNGRESSQHRATCQAASFVLTLVESAAVRLPLQLLGGGFAADRAAIDTLSKLRSNRAAVILRLFKQAEAKNRTNGCRDKPDVQVMRVLEIGIDDCTSVVGLACVGTPTFFLKVRLRRAKCIAAALPIMLHFPSERVKVAALHDTASCDCDTVLRGDDPSDWHAQARDVLASLPEVLVDPAEPLRSLAGLFLTEADMSSASVAGLNIKLGNSHIEGRSYMDKDWPCGMTDGSRKTWPQFLGSMPTPSELPAFFRRYSDRIGPGSGGFLAEMSFWRDCKGQLLAKKKWETKEDMSFKSHVVSEWWECLWLFPSRSLAQKFHRQMLAQSRSELGHGYLDETRQPGDGETPGEEVGAKFVRQAIAEGVTWPPEHTQGFVVVSREPSPAPTTFADFGNLLGMPSTMRHFTCLFCVGRVVVKLYIANGTMASIRGIDPLHFRDVLKLVGLMVHRVRRGLAKKSGKGAVPEKNSACEVCGKTGVPLLACSRCKGPKYCSRECQRKHWKSGGHKAVCGT